jgi:hypothetical protein
MTQIVDRRRLLVGGPEYGAFRNDAPSFPSPPNVAKTSDFRRNECRDPQQARARSLLA